MLTSVLAWINTPRLAAAAMTRSPGWTGASGRAEFRDIIGHYVSHHDVPEADVAAALAVVAQGDTPLLLSADDVRFQRFERDERGDRRERSTTGERTPRVRSTKPMAPYRIEVGKRHRVEPRQIVGALANEGGLSRDDFGHIQIRPDFSIVGRCTGNHHAWVSSVGR